MSNIGALATNEERYGGAIEALDETGKTSSAEALAAARWKRT